MLTEASSLKLRLSAASIAAAVCAAGWLWNYMGLHTLRNRLAMCTSAVKVTVAAANAGLTPEELKDLIDGVLRVANRYAELGVSVAVAQVWTPTGEDHKSGVGPYAEVVLLCESSCTEADFSKIARRVSADLTVAGVQTLGATSPYMTSGGLFGVTTDATTLKRTGTGTGVIVDL